MAKGMKILLALVVFSTLIFPNASQAQTPLLDVNPVLLDFGTLNVGESAVLTVTLSNLTSAPLPITRFSASGSGNFSIDVNGGGDPCGSENPTLDPLGSCTMAVTFAPTFAESATGSVSFTPDDQATSAINVRFLGEAEDPNSGGGCSLGAGGLVSGGALWAFFPLLLGLARRFWA